jgi:glutaredoxin 3
MHLYKLVLSLLEDDTMSEDTPKELPEGTQKKETAEVTVYSTNSCPWCVKVKDFLKENNVAYNDVNVTEDPKALEEMVDKSGQRGVPVIDIKGTIIVGFDRDAITAALGIEG